MSTDESRKTGEATDAGEGESQQDVIDRLAPSCVCPDDLCLGETGDCAVCQQIDPEWDCLQALATPDADDASEWNPRWNYHLGGQPRSICACSDGPYEGARLATLPRFCERCGGLVIEVTASRVARILAARVSAAATRAADDRAERIAQGIEALATYTVHEAPAHGGYSRQGVSPESVRRSAAAIARTTP